jgi:hypothetical protein
VAASGSLRQGHVRPGPRAEKQAPPGAAAAPALTVLRPRERRVVFVGIDTGIKKTLDREQGEWLLEVSKSSPKAKVLLTGTPIYVNNTRQPLQIENASSSFSTVDSIVRERSHNYVAAIGGDIHNYQRYPLSVDGRTIQYIVSGGGGAFMHATHPIPKVDVAGLVEDDFKCYPLRRDSLAAYSRLFDQKLGRLRFGRRVLELTPRRSGALSPSEARLHTDQAVVRGGPASKEGELGGCGGVAPPRRARLP